MEVSDLKLQFHINIDAASSELVRAIREVTQNVTLGILAVGDYPDAPIKLPDVFLNIHFHDALISSESTRNDCRTWLLGVGLRDALGALELFLVRLRFLAGIYRRSSEQGIAVQRNCTLDEFLDDLREEETTAFAKLNWRAKLGSIRREFGFVVEWYDEILSINKVRNCLTHRGGFVARQDINDQDSNALVMKYRVLELVHKAPEEEYGHALTRCSTVPAGHAIYMKPWVLQRRSFELGTRIEITPQEFVYLLLTIQFFGLKLLGELTEYGDRLGIPRTRETSD